MTSLEDVGYYDPATDEIVFTDEGEPAERWVKKP
jgi:hypothetical protein